MIKPITYLICAGIPLTLCTLLAAPPSGANQGTFRVISALPTYSQPGGLLEGSPGVFYSGAQLAGTGSPAVFSVTAKGATTTLTTFPSSYSLIGFLASGSNGRFYSGAAYQLT